MIYQLQPSDLLPLGSASQTEILKSCRQEIEGMDLRLSELEAALSGSKPIPQLLTAITELNAKRDIVCQRIEGMEIQKAVVKSKPIKAVQDLLKVIASKPENEQHDLRLRLRGLIASIVEKVEVEPYRVKRLTEARIKLTCKGCSEGLEIDTGKASVEDVKLAVRIYKLPSVIV
jgi:hypothetical protein